MEWIPIHWSPAAPTRLGTCRTSEAERSPWGCRGGGGGYPLPRAVFRPAAVRQTTVETPACARLAHVRSPRDNRLYRASNGRAQGWFLRCIPVLDRPPARRTVMDVPCGAGFVSCAGQTSTEVSQMVEAKSKNRWSGVTGLDHPTSTSNRPPAPTGDRQEGCLHPGRCDQVVEILHCRAGVKHVGNVEAITLRRSEGHSGSSRFGRRRSRLRRALVCSGSILSTAS